MGFTKAEKKNSGGIRSPLQESRKVMNPGRVSPLSCGKSRKYTLFKLDSITASDAGRRGRPAPIVKKVGKTGLSAVL
jgi:hypothetical protein